MNTLNTLSQKKGPPVLLEVFFNEPERVFGMSGLPVVFKAAERVSQATKDVAQHVVQQAAKQEGPPPSPMKFTAWNDNEKWMLDAIGEDSKVFSFASERLKADGKFVLNAASAAYAKKGLQGSYAVFQSMDPRLRSNIDYISEVFESRKPGAHMVLDVLDEEGAAELINHFGGIDSFLQSSSEWYGLQPKKAALPELHELAKSSPIVSQGGTPPNVENGSAR